MTTGSPQGADARARRRFDALVFDLDGVIVDTERMIHRIWSEVFARYGCSFSLEEWAPVVGSDRGFDPYRALVARSPRQVPDRAEVQAEVEQAELALCRDMESLPGVREWVEDADRLGMKIAVASSSPLSWVDARLSDVGLSGRFVVLSCRDENLAAKPAPDLYLDACARLQVEPARAIAIEDSANGIRAARDAGLVCVAVPNVVTAAHDFGDADLVLASLAALPLEAVLRILSERLSAA